MHQVQVFLLTLLLAVRGIESLDFCFNDFLQGSRLNSTILKKVDVSSKIECVVSCVKEPCCRSINYRKRLPQGLTSLCEMLHDVVYSGTSPELKKNRFYDYIYFNEPRKDYISSCITDKDTTTPEFDLTFPAKNIQNYILLDNNVPEMSTVTLMFWMNTLQAGTMCVVSYAVEKRAAELRVSVGRSKLILKIQSFKSWKFPVPPINDGYWHHVGVTWSLGQYSIYLDGTLVYSGSGLGSGKPLRPNGVFAIGQGLLSTNGTFHSSYSFSGKLSQVNVWNYDFISTPGVNMTLISQSCSNPVGNIINWSALQDLASGLVVKEQSRSCMPLRNNTEYDIIIAPSTNDFIHIEASENIPSLQAVTITLWVKRSYERFMRYVYYYLRPGETLLSFYIDDDVFNLEIAGASEMALLTCSSQNSSKSSSVTTGGNPYSIKKAMVPTYKDEYWHHIATTWSSETGHWKIYLDGSLVSIMHGVASGITIPAGGQLLLGPVIFWAHDSSLSKLNIWDYEVDGHALSLMANKGPTFENGNVFAWYGVKSKSMGDTTAFQEAPIDLRNSRSHSVHQMNFPEASTTNYAKVENVFPGLTITVLTACFWAKILKTDCGIFTYSTSANNDELATYLYLNRTLDLIIKSERKDPGPLISAPESWHFYCMQWRNSDGLVQTFQDAIKLEMGYKAVGHIIPSNGVMVLGQQRAFKGSLAGLNFWTYFLTINTIQGMAAGIINVNGNLLQWRDFRTEHVFGDVSIVERSEAEIPEYRVQALRDQWCKNNITAAFTYARFVRNQLAGYKWRCVTPMAMLDENMCYNISKGSRDNYTKNYILEIN